MDFLNKLGIKISKGTKKLSQKTDELIGIAELKIEINSLRKEIEEAKRIIGEIIYKHYLDNHISLVEVQEKCREIQQMYQEINELLNTLSEMKGIEYCPYCNGDMEEDGKYGKYCSNCGKKIRE